jgi:uncharacterized integral membrane protein (TIGR00698 family)
MAPIPWLRPAVKPTPTEPLTFSSYDSMEGVEYAPVQAAAPRRTRVESVRRVMPGMTIAGVIALAAAWLAEHYGAPVMLFALLLGMAVNFVSQDPRCRPGVDFTARNVLRLGVALLGARITLGQIEALGGETLVIAATGVGLTIGVGWVLSRALRLAPTFGVLTGGSVAICGASAALAISSILPPSPERERETLLTVVGVTTLSTIAMVLYPVLASRLGLDALQTGVFLGATIHDVAQVVGAGYSVSQETGDTATVVKLFRVALLLPVVLVLAMAFRSRSASEARGRRPPLLPTFLLGFAALVVVNSSGVAPVALMEQVGAASRWALVAAIAALGVKTSLGELAAVGWKPILLVVAETLFVLAWVLGALLVLR